VTASENGGSLASRRRNDRDLRGIINSIAVAACIVDLAPRSVILAVAIIVAATLLVIADLIRWR
jgi:hypothetical protein